jgi:hypothetical protein
MENVMFIILRITKHTFTKKKKKAIKIAIPTAIASIAANIYRYVLLIVIETSHLVTSVTSKTHY